jgi:Mrp family chromosome partitioning ATPase
MSKLLSALRQIDAKSASTPEAPATAVDESAPVAAESSDALQKIAELQRLLEQALAVQSAEPFVESIETPIDGPTDAPSTSAEAVAERELAAALAPADGPPQPVAIAREFEELADRLLAELVTDSPAVLTFLATDALADSFWLLPLTIAILQKNSGRLLIVEAEGDVPRWPAHLGIEAEIGFVDLMESRAVWRDCVRSTAIPRLDLLPRGIGPIPATTESLAASKTLLSTAKADYSLILIAAGSADQSLAAALAGQSDGVVLVVGLKATPRSAAERAMQLLESVNARIMGAIVRD